MKFTCKFHRFSTIVDRLCGFPCVAPFVRRLARAKWLAAVWPDAAFRHQPISARGVAGSVNFRLIKKQLGETFRSFGIAGHNNCGILRFLGRCSALLSHVF